MKLPPLSASEVKKIIQKSQNNLPKRMPQERRRLYAHATKLAIEAFCRRLSLNLAPDMRDVEMEVRHAMGDKTPDFVIRSRVVLSFRDSMRDFDFRRRFDMLKKRENKKCIGRWAEMAAKLHRDWPDKKLSERPSTALKILSGDDPILRTPVAKAIAALARGKKQGLFSRMVTGVKSALGASDESIIEQAQNHLALPAPKNAKSQAKNSGLALVPRRSPKKGLMGKKSPRNPQNLPAATGRRRPSSKPKKKLNFMGRIKARFLKRGLAPVALRAAMCAARVMAERVKAGNTPDFYDVEYEVMVRSGEAIAPGAVRTWTLHAFMECMRDPWFRSLFNKLSLDDRTEAVREWAKAAADWFEVPGKLSDFWIRALSGGDPVLAAAAAPAFRKRRALPPVGEGKKSNAKKSGGTKKAASKKTRAPLSEEEADLARRRKKAQMIKRKRMAAAKAKSARASNSNRAKRQDAPTKAGNMQRKPKSKSTNGRQRVNGSAAQRRAKQSQQSQHVQSGQRPTGAPPPRRRRKRRPISEDTERA